MEAATEMVIKGATESMQQVMMRDEGGAEENDSCRSFLKMNSV
jgi:hypothetical protein